MEKLINKNQQCAVKQGKIQSHLHSLREIVTYCREKSIEGKLLSIDQEKAFERVNHDFLHNVIEANNLSQYFRNCINIFYSKANSQVLVNQHFSDEILL